MSISANCPCSPEMVDLAFRESEPFIEREIRDRSYRMRRYLVDYAPVKMFPDGIGYTMSKVRFFGDIGPQYDGFDGWRKEQRSRPFASGHKDEHDACGYNWEEVGHGFEELHYHLMKRDLKTVEICIEDIRTFWEFQQYQNLIFQNLTEITANMREQLNRNSLIGFSVKHVITSKGLEVNSSNPYELPNINNVTIGKLNFRVLKRIYSALLREAGMFALETINGRPVFGLMASDDVLDDMVYEDPEIRQDLRAIASGSGEESLIKRFNFNDMVRNQFILIPDIFAPRYKDDGNGNLKRVFPYERDVPIQSGTRPAPNPDYENAPYELVLILTRDVFTLRSRRAISTVGGETNFEAETGMFEWKWHNPERWCDPNRRVGFYFANGRLGIEPGDFTDIPAILVKRRPQTLDASFWGPAECPPDPVDCDNALDPQGCPCQAVVDCCADFTNPNILQFKFSSPITEAVGDAIEIELSNGGVASGTLTALSPDAMSASIDFGEPVECCPELYVQVYCKDKSQCSADVVSEVCNATDNTNVDLKLECALRAETAGDALVVFFEDGSSGDATIVSVDKDSLTWILAPVAPTDFSGKCIKKVCVPETTDATCPTCMSTPVTCDPAAGLP